MSALTDTQKVANAVFAEKMFRHLKDGGIWCWAEHGLEYKRVGEKYHCNIPAYATLRDATEEKWFNRRVVLFCDFSSDEGFDKAVEVKPPHEEDPVKRCDKCGGDAGRFGNNPRPLDYDTVCDDCNLNFVIPARLLLHRGSWNDGTDIKCWYCNARHCDTVDKAGHFIHKDCE